MAGKRARGGLSAGTRGTLLSFIRETAVLVPGATPEEGSMTRFVVYLTAVVLALPASGGGQAGQPSYLHLSDVHLDLSGSSSDTDPQLWAITKAKLASLLAGPDAPAFVLYTGDLPGHYECEDSTTNPDCALQPDQQAAHDADVRTVLSDLRDLVADTGIPLLYMPGNNDSLAGDYFSFTDAAGETPLSLVPEAGYPAVNASKPCGSPPCMVSNPRPGLGFYSARPVDGLRVVALNSVILGREYQEVDGVSQLDAGNAQLEWLAAELTDAEGEEKVLIAMHIPPGDDAYAVSAGKPVTWMWARQPQGEGEGGGDAAGDSKPATAAEDWLDRFLDLVAAHGDTVIGLAYGHTHLDELRRLHDRDGRITEVAVSAPGITTNHGNNPGFKRVTYDRDTKELLDFVTFYTKRGNSAWGDDRYSFSTYYGCAGQSILGCLTGAAYADTAAVNEVMDEVYTVMNGPPSYDTSSGIEVEPGQ
jgi:sphingomyelin phosphodiesterase acid-like 3